MECVGELFKRVAPHIAETECTLIGDSAFVCEIWWHYLFRICGQHTCEHWSPGGRLLPICRVSELVSEPGKRFYGPRTILVCACHTLANRKSTRVLSWSQYAGSDFGLNLILLPQTNMAIKPLPRLTH